MSEMERDVRGLDADLQGKMASLKLAHTRLESRTNRPGMDLCRDEVRSIEYEHRVAWGSEVVAVHVTFVWFLPCSPAGAARPRE